MHTINVNVLSKLRHGMEVRINSIRYQVVENAVSKDRLGRLAVPEWSLKNANGEMFLLQLVDESIRLWKLNKEGFTEKNLIEVRSIVV